MVLHFSRAALECVGSNRAVVLKSSCSEGPAPTPIATSNLDSYAAAAEIFRDDSLLCTSQSIHFSRFFDDSDDSREQGMTLKKILFAVLAMLASPLSEAGTQAGTVDYIRIRASDGLIYFALVGAPKSNSPSCATAGYWMIRDENSNAGKQQYALLLAAQLSGKTVFISGLNTCTRWADGEDVNEIRIGDLT